MFDIVKGQAFVDSYGRASRANDPEALASHYAEPYTSFTLGHVGGFSSKDEALGRMVPWMARFKEFGLDDIRIADSTLEPVSGHFCLCHLTIEIRPRDGTAPFHFLNIYGLRQDELGQRFEFAISDNEIAALTQRYPDFMKI
jgi:ketosteroid isomerase-like protein